MYMCSHLRESIPLRAMSHWIDSQVCVDLEGRAAVEIDPAEDSWFESKSLPEFMVHVDVLEFDHPCQARGVLYKAAREETQDCMQWNRLDRCSSKPTLILR